jgi:hypothetical protein
VTVLPRAVSVGFGSVLGKIPLFTSVRFFCVATAGYCTLECGYARTLCLLAAVLWWVNGAIAADYCL